MPLLLALIRYVLLLTSGLCLLISLSPSLQRKMDANGWIPNQYRYGDQYNISNLTQFKETNFIQNSTLKPSDKPSKRYSSVDLYIIGDSFTPMDTSFYAGRKNHHIWLGNNIETVELDTSQKSILIIEIIERTIQERLLDSYDELYIKMGFQIADDSQKHVHTETEESSFMWWGRFGEQINQRIEFLFFNSEIILKLKEIKADIMLTWFDRTHPGVSLSRNHDFIFYSVESERNNPLSPFFEVSEASLDSVVHHINEIRSHYKRLGFTEVYFTFLPNKVTVCEPNRYQYNEQISRITTHNALEVPLLPLHETVIKHPDWFHKGDGHWTADGQRLWLQSVNDLAKQWESKNASTAK